MKPRFGNAELLKLANQPGVHLNEGEEQALDRAWRRLQLGGCGCHDRKKAPPLPRPRAGCGGCGRR